MKIVLVFMIAAFTAINGQYIVEKVACSGESLTVSCGREEVLKIVGGNFGRKHRDVCPTGRDRTCVEPKSFQHMRKVCDNKAKCTLKSSVAEFGHYCLGVEKYLGMYYQCIKRDTRCSNGQYKCKNQNCIPNSMVCNGEIDCDEGEDEIECDESCKKNQFSCYQNGKQVCLLNSVHCDGTDDCDEGIDEIGCRYQEMIACQFHEVTINCNPGQSIKIMSGFWGRINERYNCYAEPNATDNCRLDTTSRFKELCDHKQSCTFLADNELFFRNPCDGVTKYAKVVYTCRTEYEQLISCQDDRLTINCKKGEVITLIKGFYGRESKTNCAHFGNVADTNCRAPQANDIIYNLCNRKQSCTFMADNTVFTDPCMKVFKYAEVHYKCTKVPRRMANLYLRNKF